MAQPRSQGQGTLARDRATLARSARDLRGLSLGLGVVADSLVLGIRGARFARPLDVSPRVWILVRVGTPVSAAILLGAPRRTALCRWPDCATLPGPDAACVARRDGRATARNQRVEQQDRRGHAPGELGPAVGGSQPQHVARCERDDRRGSERYADDQAHRLGEQMLRGSEQEQPTGDRREHSAPAVGAEDPKDFALYRRFTVREVRKLGEEVLLVQEVEARGEQNRSQDQSWTASQADALLSPRFGRFRHEFTSIRSSARPYYPRLLIR